MTERVRVGLVQINTGMTVTNIRWTGRKVEGGSVAPATEDHDEPSQWEILPYSVGLLQSYAQANATNPERYEFLLPIFKRASVEQAVAQLRGAHVVGFSAYVWNIRLSLAIARRLREIQPETLIVFGGPQVPDSAEAFLRENPWVDLACHGEGEQAFLAILEQLDTRDWSAVPSISYLDEAGTFVTLPKGLRLKDLSLIPSPYLTGVFDPLMKSRPDLVWMAMWETNRGCPFSCTFCDWGSAIATKVHRFDMERLLREVDWMGERGIEAVSCCDANFGILPRDVELAQYVADTKKKTGCPGMVFQNNTKNTTERAYEVQKILADSGLNLGVTLSFQSMNPHTLKSIKRDNISTDSFQELQHRFTRDGVMTYTDMILGLPDETYESFVDGVSQVIENGQHNRFFWHNCSILPNAEMGDPEYQRRYGMRTVPQRIDLAAHTPVEEPDGDTIPEYLDTVVATDAMPAEDWVRAKVFWWMTDFLFFNRLLKIPLVLLNELYGVRHRDMIETLAQGGPEYPLLNDVRDILAAKAKDIQAGGPEDFACPEWMGLWWPADQYVLIELARRGDLPDYVNQARDAISAALKARSIDFDAGLLHEAFDLNLQMLRLPFHTQDLDLERTNNLWEYYLAVVRGQPIPLESGSHRYRICRTRPAWTSWEEWYEHLIFAQNQKRYYLYGIRTVRLRKPVHPTSLMPIVPSGLDSSADRSDAR